MRIIFSTAKDRDNQNVIYDDGKTANDVFERDSSVASGSLADFLILLSIGKNSLSLILARRFSQ